MCDGIDKVEKLNVQKGDVILLYCDKMLNEDAVKSLKDAWAKAVNLEHSEIIVIDQGIKVGVIPKGVVDKKCIDIGVGEKPGCGCENNGDSCHMT